NQAFTACFAIDYVPGEDHTIPKPKDYDFWRNLVPDLTPPWPGKLLELHYSDPRTLKPKKLVFYSGRLPTVVTLYLFIYRIILDQWNFADATYSGAITIVNLPQNDYMLGDIVDVSEEEFNEHFDASNQFSFSLLYCIQTEAPRP